MTPKPIERLTMNMKEFIQKMLVACFAAVLLLNIAGCGSSSETPNEEAVKTNEASPEMQKALDQGVEEVESNSDQTN